MTTTTAAPPASSERTVFGKTGPVKPQATGNSTPGGFAALLMLQADEEPLPPMGMGMATSSGTQTDEPQEDRPDAATDTSAPWAVQALLDWRGISVAATTNPTSPDTVAASKGLQRDSQGFQGLPLGLAQAQAMPLRTPAETMPPIATAEAAPMANAEGTPAQTPATAANTFAPDGAERPAGVGKSKPGLSAGKAGASALPLRGPSSSADSGANTPAPGTLTTKTQEAPGHFRSTLELGQKETVATPLPPAENPAPGTLERTAVTGVQAAAAPTGEGVLQAEGGGLLSPNPSEAPAANTASFADMLQGQMEQVDTQITYWSAQGAQRASFTVEADNNSTLEVNVSFTANGLDVAFETGEAHVRDALQQSAQDILQQLMEAQGLTLASVSVGGGQTHNQPGAQTEHPATTALARASRGPRPGADAGTPTAPLLPRTPQIITATQLDFYA